MTADGQVVDDAIGRQLNRRIEEATGRARRALGWVDDDGRDNGRDAIATLIEALHAELSKAGDDGAERAQVEAHDGELKRLERRYRTRFDALRDVDVAVASLRQITVPDAILARAPLELCQHSGLDRVVLSLVRDRHLVAEAVYFRGDPVGAAKALEALRDAPPRLEHPLLETDLLRRRRTTIVTDVQIDRRRHGAMAKIMGWHGYLVAPLLVGGDLLGAIHADTGLDGRAIDVLDGDIVWTFARGLADAYETTSLRRSLRRQREEMGRFVEWLSARAIELSNTSIELIPEQTSPPDPPGKLELAAGQEGTDDRLVFWDLLTRRELDVLRLVARGKTNGAIAAQLVISEATVKFHVVNTLRKLRVSSRAEAVARYHRLMRAGRRQP